jgi:hypothetical protein
LPLHLDLSNIAFITGILSSCGVQTGIFFRAKVAATDTLFGTHQGLSMTSETSKDRRTFQGCFGCVIMVIVLLMIPVTAFVAWDWSTERKVRAAESRARTAGSVSDLLTMFGKPYYVYRDYAPELGRDLVAEDGKIPEGQAVYVFLITGMPPNFVVALVDDISGKVLKIGLDKS